MSGEISKLFVSIGANMAPMTKALKHVDKQVEGTGQNITKNLGDSGKKGGSVFGSMLMANMATAAASAGLNLGKTLIGGFVTAIQSASDLNETLNKTEVLLGKSADEAIRFAKEQAGKGVASQKEVLDSVTSTFLMLKNQGVASDVAMKKARELETRMGDISSISNIDPKELRERIQSGLSGELQTLRGGGLNISLTADQMKSKYGAESALGKGDGVATGLATIDAIIAQTGYAAGDLEKTQYSMANMARANAVKWDEGLSSVGQFFQDAGQAFEFLKSTVLDALLTSLGDGKIQEAGNNIYMAFMDLASVFMEFGPQIASELGGMITWITDAFRGITQVIKMAFVDPLNLVKSAISGFGIMLIDAYKYLSKFVGGSGLPLDEWRASLVDMQNNAISGMVDNVLAKGDSNFAEDMRKKFQAGGTGDATPEAVTPEKQMQKEVKSSRSSLDSLLSNVVGGQDEKLLSVNEAQLAALQTIAGAFMGKGPAKPSAGLNTISSDVNSAVSALAGGLV